MVTPIPGTLQLALKARQLVNVNKPATLYRAMVKELPRVMAIYDIDLELKEARKALRGHFLQNAKIQDERVIDMLVEVGYMELEGTLLQHKQRSHFLRIFEGYIHSDSFSRNRLGPDATIDEQFARN